MKRKVVVYGHTTERAIREMNKIHSDTNEYVVKRTRDTIETSDKIYVAVVAKESNRGLKFNDAYVDLEISLRLFFNTIQYQMIASNGDYSKGFIEYY